MKNNNQVSFQIATTKEGFFVDYFNAINGSVGLSNKELVVIAALVEQYNVIRKKTQSVELINELLFSSRYRTLAREKADMNDANFNNYISALKRKGVILEEENNFRKLNPLLTPIIDLELHTGLTLMFNFEIQEDEEPGIDTSGEESGTGDGDDEISPFEFPEDTNEEIGDTEESLTFFEEGDDAS
jgi:hypothetical protein